MPQEHPLDSIEFDQKVTDFGLFRHILIQSTFSIQEMLHHKITLSGPFTKN